MGIVSTLAAPARIQGSYQPWDDFWYGPIRPPVAAGVQVTADSAMRVSAVFGCVRVLAETMGVFPLILYRRLERGKSRATDHPLYRVLHDRPNQWQTRVEWVEMTMGHAVLRGNAYSQKVYGPDGVVEQLIPLHPTRMTVERLPNGRLRYVLDKGTADEQRFTQDEIFHLRGLSSDGMMGLSVLEAAREAIGFAQATEAHGAQFFGNGAHPGGVLEIPGKLSDDAYQRLKADWATHYTGVNAHRPALLEEGLKWTQIGMALEDAQFLETRKFEVAEIARFFRVQLHKIQELGGATFSNIEQQAREFLTDTMLPWITRFEQALQRDVVEDDDYFAGFLTDALLQGDTATRFTAYASAITNGWMTRNEVRERENLNPLPGLDEPLEQLNMASPGQRDPGAPKALLTAPPAPPNPAAPAAQRTDLFRVLIADAAERIAKAQLRELEKRADKAAADRPRFRAWLAEFFAEHATYIERTLTPLAEAWALEAGVKPDVAALARAEADDARVYLAGCDDVPAGLESWRDGHQASFLTDSILEAFRHVG